MEPTLQVIHGEVKTYPCHQLDEILQTICTTQLTQDIYRNFAKYREAFLTDFLKRSGACYAGYILFQLDDTNWTLIELLSDTMRLDSCGGYSEVAVMIRWKSFDTKIGHAMMLLLDVRDKTIELFEPNGPGTPWDDLIIQQVQRYFDNRPEFTGYRFIEPGEDLYCPTSGWQVVSHDQMCANWSLLYAVLRLSCPNVPRADLIEMIRSRGQDYLRYLMEQFQCYMGQYSRDNFIIAAVDARRDMLSEPLKRIEYKSLPRGWNYDITRLNTQFDEAFDKGDYETAVDVYKSYKSLFGALALAADAYMHVRFLNTHQTLPIFRQLFDQLHDDFESKQYAKVVEKAKEYTQLAVQASQVDRELKRISDLDRKLYIMWGYPQDKTGVLHELVAQARQYYSQGYINRALDTITQWDTAYADLLAWRLPPQQQSFGWGNSSGQFFHSFDNSNEIKFMPPGQLFPSSNWVQPPSGGHNWFGPITGGITQLSFGQGFGNSFVPPRQA